MTHRPQCVECGARYGHRDTTSETVRWPKGEPMPPYMGNGKVVKVGHCFTLSTQEITRASLQRVRMRDLNEHEVAQIERAPEVPMFTTTITIWDGESWHAQHKPFCSLRCALKYARGAYKESQMQMEDDAK